jgi:hypothetical protein
VANKKKEKENLKKKKAFHVISPMAFCDRKTLVTIAMLTSADVSRPVNSVARLAAEAALAGHNARRSTLRVAC